MPCAVSLERMDWPAADPMKGTLSPSWGYAGHLEPIPRCGGCAIHAVPGAIYSVFAVAEAACGTRLPGSGEEPRSIDWDEARVARVSTEPKRILGRPLYHRPLHFTAPCRAGDRPVLHVPAAARYAPLRHVHSPDEHAGRA